MRIHVALRGAIAAVLLGSCSSVMAGASSLFFDGVDDYVNVGNFGTTLPSAGFTIEFWAKPMSANKGLAFVLAPDNVSNRVAASISSSDGNIYFDYGNVSSGRLTGTPPFSPMGQWHHYAFVGNNGGNSMQIYQDGTLVNTFTTTASYASSPGSFQIGGIINSNFVGYIDEFHVWSTFHSAAQVQTDMTAVLNGSETGLLGAYSFDEGSGNIAANKKSGGATGLLQNGPIWTSDQITVVSQNAINVTSNSATLTATYTANGVTGTTRFNYGTTAAMSTTTGSSTLTYSRANRTSSAVLTGLATNTLYFFQFFASTTAGNFLNTTNVFYTGPMSTNTQLFYWLQGTTPTNALAVTGTPATTNFYIATPPLNGNLILQPGFRTNGLWQYQPRSIQFYGDDSFVFAATDGSGNVITYQRVLIHITRNEQIDNAPTAHDQFLKTRPNQALKITLTADDDEDYRVGLTNGSYAHFSPNSCMLDLQYFLVSSPTNGTLTATTNAGYILPDLVYTPTPGVSNVFDSFKFQVSDGTLTSPVPATVMVRIGSYNAGTNYFSNYFGTNFSHYADVPLVNPGTIRPGFEGMAFANGTFTNDVVINGRTDDGSVQMSLAAAPFLDRAGRSNSISFFGKYWTNLFINNNGTVSSGGPISAFTPSVFPVGDGISKLSPMWMDVTTSSNGNYVTFGRGYIYGRLSTIVTWNDVEIYNTGVLDRFQLVMIDRSDIGDGLFDFEYNYEYCDALAGTSSGTDYASIGFDAGDNVSYYNYPSSHSLAATGMPTNNIGGVPGRLLLHGYAVPTNGPAIDRPYFWDPSQLFFSGEMPTYAMLGPTVFTVSIITNGVTNWFADLPATSFFNVNIYQTNRLLVTALVTNGNTWPEAQYIVRLTNAVTQVGTPAVGFEKPKLLSLILNPSLPLSPSFGVNITNYNAYVPRGTTSSVTLMLSDTNHYFAQTRYNTNAPSGPIANAVASPSFVITNNYPFTNFVYVDLFSSVSFVRTYTISMLILPSTESRLSALSLSNCTLSPTFSSNTTNYTSTVASPVGSTVVSATALSSVATNTYSFNGGAFSTNTFFAFNPATTNEVRVRCTAEDGVTVTTYKVTVTRLADTNATLAAINLSLGTLSPSFSPGTTQYSATVGLSVTNITVGALTAYSNATVSINGSAFVLQTNAATVPLSYGNNSISIVVQAENGVIKTYTLTVLRTPPVAITLPTALMSTNGFMRGSFDWVNAPTKVYFQYGATASYGSFSPTNQVLATSSALTFNGTDQYVRTTNRITNDFTIEFKFKSTQNVAAPGPWNTGRGLVDGEATGGTNGFGVSFGNGKIMFGVGNPGPTLTSGVLTDNNWHHVAATRNGSAIELFIDGASVALTNAANAGAFNQVKNLMIGALAFTNNFFQGSIDEVRIWNTARTIFQIQRNTDQSMSGDEPGLLNYFHFDEGTGSTTADISRAGGIGILSNSPVWTTVAVTTNYSAALVNLSRASSYHCRIVAESGAAIYQGDDFFFFVGPEAPIVLTTSATVTNSVTATLNASLNPAGAPTAVRFLWGTNDVLGKFTDSSAWISVGSGDVPVTTNLTVTGLIPARDYHFWIQATNFMNSGSPVQGTNTLFTTLTPFIVSASPLNGPTVGSTLVTVDGAYLGGSGSVTLGGLPCTITSYTNTRVKFLTPTGSGANLPINLTVEGKYVVTTPTTFSYDPPALISVNPNHGPTVGGTAITLVGTNFGNQTATASVTIGGQPASVSSCNHTQIVCQLPAGQGTNKAVVVTISGQPSLSPVTFSYDGPTITNVSPNVGPTAGGIEITLTGSSFGTNGTLFFNGLPISTTGYNQSQIKFMLPAGQGVSNTISVDVSGQLSPNAYFNYGVPGITSVSPNHGPAAGGVEITVGGTNFGTSGTLTLNGQTVTPTSYSNTQIKFMLPAGQGTNNSIVVGVSGQNSAAVLFSYDGPMLFSASPNHGPTIGGVEISLIGTNFGTSGIVTFNGQVVSSTTYSNTVVKFMLPAGQGTNNPIQVNVDGQNTSPLSFGYDDPIITNIFPATGPSTGGTTITLSGSNFGTNGTVTIGGQNCSIVSCSHTQIVCTSPAGQGLNQALVVQVETQTSNTKLFGYYGGPIVTTLGADSLTGTVYGSVNPNGAETAVYFEYGTNAGYGLFSATNVLPIAETLFSVSNLLANLQVGAAYHYRVVAENPGGTTYGADNVFTNSPMADLGVSISSSPEPVGLGTNLIFSITVTNNGPNPSLAVSLTNTLPANVNFVSASEGGTFDSGKVTYEFSNLESGESTNITIVVVPLTWSGDVTNYVSVSGGLLDTNLENNSAFVVVSGAPMIDLDPISRTNNAGTTASFSVGAHGNNVSFQWLKNGSPLTNNGKISGADTALLTVLNVLAADAGNYSVIVSNTAGTATSAVAALTVIDPFISGQPANQTLTNLGTISLSVTAIGTSPLKYQWLKNGVVVAKATNSFFLKTNAVTADAGVYTVRVVNALSNATTSVGAVVSVDLPIAITKQPVGLVKTYGQIAVAKFSVTALGNNQKYQWRKNGAAIAGATSSLYVVPVITNAPGVPDIYSAIVSNGSYSVTSSDASLVSLADTNVPTVSITTPKAIMYNDATVIGYKMGIGGAAADNAQVTNVLFSLNGSAFAPVSLNTNGPSVKWTNAAVTVKPGTNVLQVYSVDYSGLPSKMMTVKFIYAVRSSFTLITNNLPAGDVVNLVKPTLDKAIGTNDGSAQLLVGCGYKLTALNVFTNGYIFTNWTFTSSTNATQLVLETNSLLLNYVMRSNMTIYANFITNPFAIYKGTYNGLFHEADEVRHHSAGYVSVMTTEKLGYSGKLLLDGDTVSFSGKFNLDGTATNTLSRAALGKSSLRLVLVMDFAGASQTVTGSVSDIAAGWSSEIVADRYLWKKSGNPATLYATNYTVAIPGFDDNNTGPVGYGYALVTVDADGNIKAAGGTSDGQTLAQATMLSQAGRWPLHMPLYADTNDIVSSKAIKRTRGELMGWLTFEANTNAFDGNTNLAPVGKIDWIKTRWTNNSWAVGFTNQVDVISSVQKAPVLGEVLYAPFTNFLAVLSEGAQSSSISNVVILKTNNIFFVDPKRTNDEPVYAGKFSAQLMAKTGFISGTFTNETSQGKSLTWKGVLLQDYTNGYGSFLNPATTNASGTIRLSPITNSIGD